ncbi:MAG: protein-glutamate O-methyltransferase CheR [Desulfoplanes sp.]
MTSSFTKSITLRKQVTMDDVEFGHLRDFIYEKCGIYIPDNRKYLLENRLLNRLRFFGLRTFGEYFYFLKSDQGGKTELQALFEVITTNETSFYRNPAQLKVLENGLLKSVMDEQLKKGSRDIHIWSAGCSTGEEPYTLEIILHEILNAQRSLWNITIMAGDLSEAVLASAARGEYTEYALRTTPKAIIARYFTPIGNGRYRRYLINPEIKKHISFHQINLNDRAQLRNIRRSHIIFCRNVLIYFDEAMKKRVISSFYDNLLPGGYLFIGHSESLHNISRVFKPIHYPSAIVYRKEG